MSLISSDVEIKFPTEPREVHPYRLFDNYILTITENFEYQVMTAMDTATNNVIDSTNLYASGTFPEDPKEAYYILGPETFFFDVVNKNEIIYYSPTDKNIKQFNLKTATVTGTFDCTLDLNRDNYVFMSLVYYKAENKVRLLHTKDQNNITLREIKADGSEEVIQEIAMKNVNCMVRNEGRCFYASQILYKEPMRIGFFSADKIGTISFDIKEEDVTPLDFGFLNETTVLIVYNSNADTGNGLYVLNLNDFGFDGDISIDPKDSDKCTKINLTLPDGEIECYDGRMIIDRVVRTLTLFGYVSF